MWIWRLRTRSSGAFGSNGHMATLHYVMHGYNEGRITDGFDENHYLASNDHLISMFKNDRDGATQHYVETGYNLGYETSSFDVAQYLANYSDLQAAFGNDYSAAVNHYIEYGYDEGRVDDILA